MEGDAKPRRRKFVEYPEKSSTARSPQERRDDVAEDGKQGQERDRGEGGGEERKRTSKFREERAERPSGERKGHWNTEKDESGIITLGPALCREVFLRRSMMYCN